MRWRVLENFSSLHLAYQAQMCYICVTGKPEHIKAAYPPIIGGANPPDQEGKEGDANVCYSRNFCLHVSRKNT